MMYRLETNDGLTKTYRNVPDAMLAAEGHHGELDWWKPWVASHFGSHPRPNRKGDYWAAVDEEFVAIIVPDDEWSLTRYWNFADGIVAQLWSRLATIATLARRAAMRRGMTREDSQAIEVGPMSWEHISGGPWKTTSEIRSELTPAQARRFDVLVADAERIEAVRHYAYREFMRQFHARAVKVIDSDPQRFTTSSGRVMTAANFRLRRKSGRGPMAVSVTNRLDLSPGHHANVWVGDELVSTIGWDECTAVDTEVEA